MNRYGCVLFLLVSVMKAQQLFKIYYLEIRDMDCPDKFFRNVNGACQKCMYGCKNCLSSAFCEVCDQFFTLTNGQCKYVDKNVSMTGPIIVVTIVVSFILGFILLICYSNYKQQQRKRKEKDDEFRFNDAERKKRQFSEEKVHNETPQSEQLSHDICLFCQKEEVNTQIKCHHKFHRKCLEEWLRTYSCCPICKTTQIYPLTTLPKGGESYERPQDDSGKAVIIHDLGRRYDILTQEAPNL